MSLTPSNVPWDSNRYKATEYVISYDSNGVPTLSKKEADYTGVNYNFASLPTGTSTTTSGVTTGTTAQTTTQTTQQQTSEAFGDVTPHYWDDGGDKDKAEAEKAENVVESEVGTDDDEYEVEVVDDTPKADRNRKPSDPPEDITDDELEDYSEKVRKRIQHFSKGYHDERRAKEAAFREREELERLSQQLVEENKKLKSNVNKNQTALLEQAKRNVITDLESAKKRYKDAYEAGDSDGVLAAQEILTNANIKADRLNNFKLPALQEDVTKFLRSNLTNKQTAKEVFNLLSQKNIPSLIKEEAKDIESRDKETFETLKF